MEPTAEGLGRPARILIVEDQEVSRRLMTRCLTGHELVEASDGETALAYLAEHDVDLVLLDIGLPGIDGYEVLEALQQQPRTARVMVILVTGRNDTIDIVRGFERRAVDYLVKPYRIEELKARVAAVLRLKALQDELQRLNEGLEAEVRERTRQLLAEQRFALLGRNSGQIAHNLNSPLSTLLGYVELALATPPDQRDELLLKLRSVALDMQGILSSLLAGVRGRAAAIDETELLDLSELVRGQVDFWRVNSQFRYEVAVSVDLRPDLPPVEAIRSDLDQVLANLIDNALYAVRQTEQPRLTLRTSASGGFVRVEVTDNGCGIAPEHLDRIFEPSFTTKPLGEGTGLGLASSYELAAAYGGHLEVVSPPGVGTTVSLVLPAHE